MCMTETEKYGTPDDADSFYLSEVILLPRGCEEVCDGCGCFDARYACDVDRCTFCDGCIAPNVARVALADSILHCLADGIALDMRDVQHLAARVLAAAHGTPVALEQD